MTVRVTNYGSSWESIPVIEIGDYPLSMESEEDAEKCAAAINAMIDAALAARDAEIERLREDNRQLDEDYENLRARVDRVNADRDAQWEAAIHHWLRQGLSEADTEDAMYMIRRKRVQKGGK